MYNQRISLMLSKEDKEMLEKEAKRLKIKLSTYIRSKLLTNYEANENSELKLKNKIDELTAKTEILETIINNAK